MLRLVAWLNVCRPFPDLVRYGIAVGSFAAAFAIVFLFQALKLRDPYALIFLAGIWVSVWYGGKGPGYLGLVLGTFGLTDVLHSEDRWRLLLQHNVAVYGAFFLLAFLILRFSRERRRIEFSLKESRDRLEAEVQARTIDLTEDRIALEKALDRNKALQEQLRKENISIQESYQKLQDDVAAAQEARYGNILGSSAALRRMIMLVDSVAPTETTVLITGETGTGKELIARAIHQNSRRANGPFIAVNCAAITPTLITSELFGHEKGAFTGADRPHIGRFEQAEGGTIFLDEIGDVPLETQLALLRVLQERTFQRLGGNRSIPLNVRVVAATNRELPAAMEEGAFRKDLFYRLNAFPIEVPPLRDRRDDIPILVHHFVEASANRHGKNISNIEKRSMELLLSGNWPGNIRQLQNVIDAAVIACDGDTLSVEPRLLSKELAPGDLLLEAPLTASVLEYQRKRIEEALRQCNGQVGGQGGAAALLGMPTSTLQHRLKQLDINPHRFHKRDPED